MLLLLLLLYEPLPLGTQSLQLLAGSTSFGLFYPVAKPQAPEDDVQLFNSRNLSRPEPTLDEVLL